MARQRTLEAEAGRFLRAWLNTRQIIQAANFNRFQRAGLSATQFMTLNQLPAVPGNGLSLSALARRLNLRPPTVSKTVESLEKRGLLTREPDLRDRRSVLLKLTRRGRELQNAASGEFRQHMTALFTSLTAEQRSGLITGLESLVEADRNRQKAVRRPSTDGPAGVVRAKRSSR